MLAQQYYPYRIAVLLIALFAVWPKAHAQQELKKERGFPLGKPIAEGQGVVFCETEATAKVLVTTHAQKGIAAAREFFNKDDTPCYNSTPMMVTYRRLVFSVDTKDGKLNVYEADSGDFQMFVVTDWESYVPGQI